MKQVGESFRSLESIRRQPVGVERRRPIFRRRCGVVLDNVVVGVVGDVSIGIGSLGRLVGVVVGPVERRPVADGVDFDVEAGIFVTILFLV